MAAANAPPSPTPTRNRHTINAGTPLTMPVITVATLHSALNTSSVNLQSAESVIRDTDYAKESAEYSRHQIMLQAATAMLAQANLVPQRLLSMLNGK